MVTEQALAGVSNTVPNRKTVVIAIVFIRLIFLSGANWSFWRFTRLGRNGAAARRRGQIENEYFGVSS
jgi:hypothetical protein